MKLRFNSTYVFGCIGDCPMEIIYGIKKTKVKQLMKIVDRYCFERKADGVIEG